MTFRRSLSAADLPRAAPPPAHIDQPALDPGGLPHRCNVEQAEARPTLFALGLLPPAGPGGPSHRAAGRQVFRPPPDEHCGVRRLADRPGRPHPVFSSPLYRDFLHECAALLEQVRGGPNPGANARYIPELARRDPGRLQASVATPSGALHSFGDRTVFSIQSLCKMYLLASVLRQRGVAGVSQVIATLYSALPFDGPNIAGLLEHPLQPLALLCTGPAQSSALAALARAAGDTRFANATSNIGALGLTLLLPGEGPGAAVVRQARLMALIAGLAPARAEVRHTVSTDHAVHGSELRLTAGNQMRARVAADLMAGRVPAHSELPLPAFRQMQAYIAACSLAMDCSGLAASYAAFVAGRNVFSGAPRFDREQVLFLLEQMRVAGLYGESLEFHLATGMVAKSGVSGGIVAICPVSGLCLAVHASQVDAAGNSTRGLALLNAIAASPRFATLRAACLAHYGGAAVESLTRGL